MSDLSYDRHGRAFELPMTRFTSKVIISTAGLLLCGALNTILFKAQTKNFGLSSNSISIQTFIMFIGQYLNLIVFNCRIFASGAKRRTHFRKYKNRALMSGKHFEFSSYRFAVASLINCIASLMQLYALVTLSPSYFQMLLGCGIIFTPLIAYVTRKKKIYRHTVIGMIISAVALLLLSLTSLMFNDNTNSSNNYLGIILMICGVFLTSAQRVYEEWLLDKIETSTFRFVGLEGLYGIIILFILHIGFYSYGRIFGKSFFNIGQEFVELSRSQSLIITSIILVLSNTFYDAFGIIITRKVSATYRVVNDVARVILVWLVEIILYDIHNPNIETLNYVIVIILRLLSYGLLILGNILINEITQIEFCGLDKYFGRYEASKIDDSIVEESEEYSVITGPDGRSLVQK